VLCLCGRLWADPVQLDFSSPDNLSHITVGQTLTIDVTLSGLNLAGGEQLNYLATDIQLDTPLIISGPVAGMTHPYLTTDAIAGIVPDATGYDGTSSPGFPQGNYDALFATTGANISDNGLFFHFSVDATSAGLASISFLDVFADNGTGGPLTDFGGPLTFQVYDSAVAAPLPSVAVAGLVLLFGMVARSALSRRTVRVRA